MIKLHHLGTESISSEEKEYMEPRFTLFGLGFGKKTMKYTHFITRSIKGGTIYINPEEISIIETAYGKNDHIGSNLYLIHKNGRSREIVVYESPGEVYQMVALTPARKK